MIFEQDFAEIVAEPLDWQFLRNKRVLITGAYSMLGAYMGHFVLYLSRVFGLNIQVILLGRNKEKMQDCYADYIYDKSCIFLIQDVAEEINVEDVNYIFHFAGNCSPYFIKNTPVDILHTNLVGTFSVMELARKQKVDKVILASTREIYGELPEGIGSITEDLCGTLDSLDDRSCYPESKRVEETIAKSYYLQYGVPFNSVRLAHVYGPGMRTENDGRVMSDFIGDAINGRDIVLKSDGMAERAFCYISDAISGILYILMKGVVGEAYNLSNELESLPIRSVAEIICKASNKNIKVVTAVASKDGYCRYPRIALDNSKLHKLGMFPKVSLVEGIRRTLAYFKAKGHKNESDSMK